MTPVDTLSVPESNAAAPVRSNTSGHTRWQRRDPCGAFGTALAAMLTARRMSQNQLATLIDSDHATISRYISGERLPSLRALATIATALQLSRQERTALALAAMDAGQEATR